MKKLFFFFFTILFSLHASAPAVLAFDPIIIDKSDPSHPGSDTKNQNYIPIDTKKAAGEYLPVSVYGRQIQISQTFDPKKKCTYDPITNAEISCIFLPQSINQIKQDVGDFRNWTNFGPRYFNTHFGSTPKRPLDDASVREAFSSYNMDTTSGASNATRRLLDSKTLACLIGKRMWDASETLINPATKNPRRTDVDTIIDKLTGTRISRVAYALLGYKIFFNPSGPACTPQLKGTGLPGNIVAALVAKYAASAPNANYIKLYQNAIEPINDNSLAGTVRQCDMIEGEIDYSSCKPWENRSFPQSGAYPANGAEVMSWIMPDGAPSSSTTFGAPVSANATKDKANGFTFSAKYTHNWFCDNCIIESPTSYSGPTFLQYKVPENLEAGIRRSEAAMRWLIPEKVYTEKAYDSLAGSSTDGITLDLGHKDSKIRHEVKCQFLPLSWQSADCNPNANTIPSPTPDGEANCDPNAPETPAISVDKANFIDVAERWLSGGGKNAKKCFNDTVCRSKNAGINPDFALWAWLHESGASNYSIDKVEDFGIHGQPSAPPKDFSAQINYFLKLDPASACLGKPGIGSDYWLAFSANYLNGDCDPNKANPASGQTARDYKKEIETTWKFISNSPLPSSIHITPEKCP